MVAVYRKVEQGDLSFSQEVELKEEDWAAGAGWLQWEEAGTKQTVGDLLLLMMTQSDNVATNALTRMVGGKEHVNDVAESLGAKDTLLYQKVSSERGAVPGSTTGPPRATWRPCSRRSPTTRPRARRAAST
jgi:beta-lactamase class A